MKVPTASIIIANHNYGKYLAAAIASALGQLHVRVKVILVDDGSTDDSVPIARRFPIHIITQPNMGVSSARNAGAAASEGQFLMFLDADDILHPSYLYRCIEALKSAPRSVAYAYTKMKLFGDRDDIFESMPFDASTLLQGNFVNAAAVMKRDLFLRFGGFNENWKKGYEDYELWVRFLARGYYGIFVPEVLLLYRQHKGTRNSLKTEELEELRWQMRGTFPWLFRRCFFKHPWKMLNSMHKVRLNKRLGHSSISNQ